MKMSTKMSINAYAKKLLCKVCFDAGKPESEYSSHRVKDMNGNTTCPTLLNTECRWCFKVGHIAKFCKELEKSNKEKEKANKEKERMLKKSLNNTNTNNKNANNKNNKSKKSNNAFESLCDTDSETEPEETKSNAEFPAFPTINHPDKEKEMKHNQKEKETLSGWAAIASKPKKEVEVRPLEPVKTGLVLVSDFIKKAEEKSITNANANNANKETKQIKRSWADMSDTEDEDEDPYQNDEDLKWRFHYVPGMSDDVWDRINNDYDNTW